MVNADETANAVKMRVILLINFRVGIVLLDETLWLRPDLHRQVGSAARLIEKGVVCWLHWNRGLLREKPIRMFREGREVLAG